MDVGDVVRVVDGFPWAAGQRGTVVGAGPFHVDVEVDGKVWGLTPDEVDG